MRFDVSIGENCVNAECATLAPLLRSAAPETLDVIRSRIKKLRRGELLARFQDALTNRKRIASLMFADALIEEGIPPVFWHPHHPVTSSSLEQKFDLFLFDVRWLRRAYPDHSRLVRYRRSRELLSLSETAHHREAEYAFYAGKRPMWKIVGSLSLTEQQQWDCALLRGAPVAKRHALIQASSDLVYEAIKDELLLVRRTRAFSDEDATAALLRRHSVWVCAKMTNNSPTEIALRYYQMTGQEITRQIAAKQLEKVRDTLRKKGVKF